MFWYPWGKEAFARAKAEDKPIFLSIGYSTCYWCHVMEREVFENLSIAAQMNRFFINVKVDREEHPEIDDLYMIARHLMTQEGGWPNNLFLTPDLKPFFGGGTFAPDDSYGKPAFPRLLEWITHEWVTNKDRVVQQSDQLLAAMTPYLVNAAPKDAPPADIAELTSSLFTALRGFHDTRGGGFFQSPKFPHENYLQFLLAYHEFSGSAEALDIASFSLRKMAAGGIYDHVGCGFHRYAVDKQWFAPHFEKMLYTQAQLARTYTDAARLTGNEYFADIAKSVLDFSGGAFTDGDGGFYTAIDAETNGIEGAYYAWKAEEIESLLLPEEARFFVTFFALADIPTFPGHPETPGQVIVARLPLDIAAEQQGMPYIEVAALAAHVFNKLLAARNMRTAPNLDSKLIIAWNGLMIDALAHAGMVFGRNEYIRRAGKAAAFILERAIDNEGTLKRIVNFGRAEIDAKLEDYAYFIRGLLTLSRTTKDNKLLESAKALAAAAEEFFADKENGGFFSSRDEEHLLVRIKSGDDSAMPSPSAVMLHNWVDLYELTGYEAYLDKARSVASAFLSGRSTVVPEFSHMMAGAMRLQAYDTQATIPAVRPFVPPNTENIGAVLVQASLMPDAPQPGQECELRILIDIREGWYINAAEVSRKELIPTQVEVQERSVEVVSVNWPKAKKKTVAGEKLSIYEGNLTVSVRLKLSALMEERPKIRAMLSFQPCKDGACYKPQNKILTV